MQLYTIDTGYFKLDGGAMFGVVPKSLWHKAYPADDRNLCTWAMRCMLVEEGNRLVLIDTGLGNKQSEKFFSHYEPHGDTTLVQSLAAHGFTPNDITDVFLTHLHFDHCGGAVERSGDKLIPAFPNATYWSHTDHWQWALHPNDREKASFLPENILPIEASGQLQWLSGSGTLELFPGFSILTVDGHTEKQMLPVLTYKGRQVIYMADLLPSTVHIPIPWVMAYDVRPLQSMEEKHSILQMAADSEAVLFFEHDRYTECCTVHMTDKGVRLNETCRLRDL